MFYNSSSPRRLNPIKREDVIRGRERDQGGVCLRSFCFSRFGFILSSLNAARVGCWMNLKQREIEKGRQIWISNGIDPYIEPHYKLFFFVSSSYTILDTPVYYKLHQFDSTICTYITCI